MSEGPLMLRPSSPESMAGAIRGDSSTRVAVMVGGDAAARPTPGEERTDQRGPAKADQGVPERHGAEGLKKVGMERTGRSVRSGQARHLDSPAVVRQTYPPASHFGSAGNGSHRRLGLVAF